MPTPPNPRPQQLAEAYLQLLDAHLLQLAEGKAERSLSITDFAQQLFVHPTHLSNTLQQVLGVSPCDVYEQRLLATAQKLLRESPNSVAEIASTLHYDPSNFSKFFKSYAGITPGAYRKQHRENAG